MPISEELVKQLNEPNYYARLGLERNAEDSEITKAYRKISLQVHPDKNNGDGSLFKKLGEAYKTLQDAQKRAEYDLSLKESSNTHPKSNLGTAPSSAPTMIIEVIDSLEKLNNLISKIDENSKKLLLSYQSTDALSKIKLKQKKFYFTDSGRYNSLLRAVIGFVELLETDTKFFIRTNNIILTDCSFLEMGGTFNPGIIFPKIISATEDIEKQIQNALQLLKQKMQDSSSEINNFIAAEGKYFQYRIDFISARLERLFNSTYGRKDASPEFKKKLEKIYWDPQKSPMYKLELFYTEIDNFEDEKKLKEKNSSIIS